MMKERKPLLSAEELEALMQGWGAGPHQTVDRFFPVRIVWLVVLSLAHVAWLLFDHMDLAMTLTKDGLYLQRLQTFLYFRGWFLATLVGLGFYSYLQNWYPAIVSSAILLLGCMNLLSDMFVIYAERLASPTPLFTTLLLLRVSALWLMYMNVRNASRMPARKDRLNVLLPFRHEVQR